MGPAVNAAPGVLQWVVNAQRCLNRHCGVRAAPEVLQRPRGYDAKQADVWSSGVMLFAMLSCAYPFERPEDDRDPRGHHRVVQRIINGARPLPSSSFLCMHACMHRVVQRIISGARPLPFKRSECMHACMCWTCGACMHVRAHIQAPIDRLCMHACKHALDMRRMHACMHGARTKLPLIALHAACMCWTCSTCMHAWSQTQAPSRAGTHAW